MVAFGARSNGGQHDPRQGRAHRGGRKAMILFMLGLVSVAWFFIAPIVIGKILWFLTDVMIGPCEDKSELVSRKEKIFVAAVLSAGVLWLPMVLGPFSVAFGPS